MLKIQNLTATVSEKQILKDISYTFEKGKTYAIMGPNGSGKSTLASAVMGHPTYEVSGSMELDGTSLDELQPHERAQKGLFMSFQAPLSLSGVTLYQLLRFALHGTRDPLEVRMQVKKYAAQLGIKEELLSRSLNEDFSGGEKKKMEVLQAMVLQPKCMFFDEIDTGVDVDALKTLAKGIATLKGPDKTLILITHYNRLLKYLKPDVVLVIGDGTIVTEGDYSLAEKVEMRGYDGV